PRRRTALTSHAGIASTVAIACADLPEVFAFGGCYGCYSVSSSSRSSRRTARAHAAPAHYRTWGMADAHSSAPPDAPFARTLRHTSHTGIGTQAWCPPSRINPI